MQAIDIIRNLAATDSRLEKESILLDAFYKGHREFFVGAKMAYDCLVTFGIKQVVEIEDEDDGQSALSFADFTSLANKLRRRELTGNAAKAAIRAAAERSHIPTWNEFYRRILLKDLKCGVTESTINKVLEKAATTEADAKDYIIPVFSCQLAHDGAKPPHDKKIKGKKLLDIKLDGVRLLTVLDKEQGTVTQYTRNGKLNENFTEVREALARTMAELPGSVVLDGEIVSTSFQELMTQVNRREGVDTSAARLALFDIIPLADFRTGTCTIDQSTRHAILSELETTGLLRRTTEGLAYVIPKTEVDLDTEEGQKGLADFNRMALDAGYEGVMVKEPTAPYECKRSAAWLKIKPWIEVSLEVVALQEGDAGSKYQGMLGALVCRGVDDGREIEVNVGSGLSDEQRGEIWANQDAYIGMIAEVRADAITKDRNSEVYSLRFPRFKGWRGTEKGEKL